MGRVKQWFYSEDGEQRGPVTEETLRGMHRTGKLRDDSLVWTDGMDGWRKIDSLPGWEASPYESPASAMVQETVPVNWDGYEADGPQVRPWLRYWARTVDSFIGIIAISFPLAAFLPEIEQVPALVQGMIFLAGTLITEPLFFALFGTTPGKALFRIRVRNRDGGKLSFGRAFGRRLSVLIRGEGLGIPVVALVAQLMAYSRLSNRGVTTWDEHSGFVVSHRSVEWWRWLIFIAILVVFIALMLPGSHIA